MSSLYRISCIILKYCKLKYIAVTMITIKNINNNNAKLLYVYLEYKYNINNIPTKIPVIKLNTNFLFFSNFVIL